MRSFRMKGEFGERGPAFSQYVSSQVFSWSSLLIPLTAAFLFVFAGCGGEDVAVVEPFALYSVTPDSAGYEDTIVVTGEGFNPDPASNVIVFSPCGFSNTECQRVSVPISVSGTELVGIVPDGAFTGRIRVENRDPLEGDSPFRVAWPPFPSIDLPFGVALSSGDVGKVYYAGTRYTFSIETEEADDYLLIIFNSSAPPSAQYTYWYTVSLEIDATFMEENGDRDVGSREFAGGGSNYEKWRRGTALMSSKDREGADTHHSGGTGRDNTGFFLAANYGESYSSFKRRIRSEIEELLRRRASGAPHLFPPPKDVSKITGAGAPPQTVEFNVLVDPYRSTLDPDNFTVVSADLKYEGDHALLYVDQRTPPQYLTDQDAEDLGLDFDNQIHPINRAYFGEESDINGEGKVAILLTPVVNEMTPAGTAWQEGFISGFFMPGDLLPDLVDPRVTNGMEIFYTVVPDPDTLFGNYFPKAETIEYIRSTIAHEFQHMIMFNYRVLIYGRGRVADYMEDLWLEEGLSHIAEDLNGFDQGNIGRANIFLEDPGNVTLVYGGDALDERGASFLFLRYLGDRFGDGIFRELVQSRSAGTANVEEASEERFKELFADWSSACYLSGLGITADERFNYTSIDLRGDFDPLSVIRNDLSVFEIAGDVKSMGPEFIQFSIPSGISLSVTIDCTNVGRMNAVIIRLD